MKDITYTIYAKQAALPIIGDEHYPDGCVGMTFPNTPSATRTDVLDLIEQLTKIADKMVREG